MTFDLGGEWLPGVILVKENKNISGKKKQQLCIASPVYPEKTLIQKDTHTPMFTVKVSHSVMSDSLRPHGLYSPWNSPGQNTRVGSSSLLQDIFPTQGSNPGLLHCGRILYGLSHQGSPRTLEWVAYPFSRGSSLSRN